MPQLYHKKYIPSDTRFIRLSETELYAIKWPSKKHKQLAKIQPIEGEIWRPVPEMYDIIFVSNLGRIKSVRTMRNGRLVEKELTGKTKKNGKRHISLRHDNRMIQDYVCRIVLKVFNPIPNMDRRYAIEIDGDPANTALSNLKWATKSEHFKHLKATGVIKPLLKKREVINPITGKITYRNTKFSDHDVSEMIRLFNAGVSVDKIKEIFDCSTNQIQKFCKGQKRKEPLESFDEILQRETVKKPRKPNQ
jgi:hypothetical protein